MDPSTKKIVIIISVVVILLILVVIGYKYYENNPSVISKNPKLNGYNWACTKNVGGSNSANIISRNKSGTIQCLGPGGANCYWFPNVSACQAEFQKDLDSSNTSIFECPTKDQTNSSHWCYQSRTDV